MGTAAYHLDKADQFSRRARDATVGDPSAITASRSPDAAAPRSTGAAALRCAAAHAATDLTGSDGVSHRLWRPPNRPWGWRAAFTD